ncbi:MAG: DUF2937 family protein [Gammaproteobacteria bacterium]|nr:DUF2937 family protein [Gammaproteobacteria bacterium]
MPAIDYSVGSVDNGAMRIVRGILDRLVLLAAVFAAACVPSFIAQYRQRLGGRLDQARDDLAPFQALANHQFGGSLAKLVDHHLASRDATFHQEGLAVQAMIDAVARLRDALQSLDTDLLHQCFYLLRHPDYGLLESTWTAFQPGFTLTMQGVLFSLGLGLIVWLLFLGIWQGAIALARIGGRAARDLMRRRLARRGAPRGGGVT